MINTLNETHLHKTLKTLYSIENDGSMTEAKAGISALSAALPPAKLIISARTTAAAGMKPK